MCKVCTTEWTVLLHEINKLCMYLHMHVYIAKAHTALVHLPSIATHPGRHLVTECLHWGFQLSSSRTFSPSELA